MSERPLYKLYPSDLTWLYGSCPRCFYLKLRHRVCRPDGGFPAIFSKIDSAIKRHCLELERTELVCPDMPPGRFLADAPKSVQSHRFALPGSRSSFVLCGKPDAIVEWDQGGYGVIDFKTSALRGTGAGRYGDQLEIYALALETPAKVERGLEPVGLMGLLVWEPDLFSCEGPGEALRLHGQLGWVPVHRRKEALRATLRGVMAVLDGASAPPPGEECKFCHYPSELERLKVTNPASTEAAEASAVAAPAELAEAATPASSSS